METKVLKGLQREMSGTRPEPLSVLFGTNSGQIKGKEKLGI